MLMSNNSITKTAQSLSKIQMIAVGTILIVSKPVFFLIDINYILFHA